MYRQEENASTDADVIIEIDKTPLWAVYARGYDAQVSHANLALETELYAMLRQCLHQEDIEKLIHAIQNACRKHPDAKIIFANLLSRSEFQPPGQDEPGGTFYVKQTRYERVGIRHFNGRHLRAILWHDDIIGPEFEFKLAQLFAKEIIDPNGYIFRRAIVLANIVCKEGAKYLSRALTEKAYGRHSLTLFCQRLILKEGKNNPQLLFDVAEELAVTPFHQLRLRLYQAIPKASLVFARAQAACDKIKTTQDTTHPVQQPSCTSALIDMLVKATAEAQAENVAVASSEALRNGLLSVMQLIYQANDDFQRVLFFLKLVVLMGSQIALVKYVNSTHVKVVRVADSTTSIVRKEYAASLKNKNYRIDDSEIAAKEITESLRSELLGFLLRERLNEYVSGQTIWFDLRQILGLYASYKMTKNLGVDRANISLKLVTSFQALTKEGLVENFHKLAVSFQRLGDESLKQLHTMLKIKGDFRADLLQYARERLRSYILEDSTDNMVNIFQFFYWLLPNDLNELLNVVDSFTRIRKESYASALKLLREEITKPNPDFPKIIRIYHRLNDIYETSREFNIDVSIYELPSDCKNLQIEYLEKLNLMLRRGFNLEDLQVVLRALISLNTLCLDVRAGCKEMIQKMLSEIDWRTLFGFLLNSDSPSVIIKLLQALKPLVTAGQFTQLMSGFAETFCAGRIERFTTICTWLTHLKEISQDHVLAQKLQAILAQQPQFNRTAVMIHLGLHAGTLVGTSQQPVELDDDVPEYLDIATAKLACVFVERSPPGFGLAQTTIRQSQFRQLIQADFTGAKLHDISFVRAELIGHIKFNSARLEEVNFRDVRIDNSCRLDFSGAELINVNLSRLIAQPFPVKQIIGFNSDAYFNQLLIYNCELLPQISIFTREQLQNAFWNLVRLLAHFGNLTTKIILYDLIENGMIDYLSPPAHESYQAISMERSLFSKPVRAARWNSELSALKKTIAAQLVTDAVKHVPLKVRALLPEELKILIPKRTLAAHQFVLFNAAETLLLRRNQLSQTHHISAEISSPVAAPPVEVRVLEAVDKSGDLQLAEAPPENSVAATTPVAASVETAALDVADTSNSPQFAEAPAENPVAATAPAVPVVTVAPDVADASNNLQLAEVPAENLVAATAPVAVPVVTVAPDVADTSNNLQLAEAPAENLAAATAPAAVPVETVAPDVADTSNNLQLAEAPVENLVAATASAAVPVAAPIVIPIAESEIDDLDQLVASFLQQPLPPKPESESRPKNSVHELNKAALQAARAKKAAQNSAAAAENGAPAPLVPVVIKNAKDKSVRDPEEESEAKLNDDENELNHIETTRRLTRSVLGQNVSGSLNSYSLLREILSVKANLTHVTPDEISNCYCRRRNMHPNDTIWERRRNLVPPQSPSFIRVAIETAAASSSPLQPPSSSSLQPPSSNPSK